MQPTQDHHRPHARQARPWPTFWLGPLYTASKPRSISTFGQHPVLRVCPRVLLHVTLTSPDASIPGPWRGLHLSLQMVN